MSVRQFSRSEVVSILAKINEAAITLELVPEDVTFYFQPGSEGHAPEIRAYTPADNGNGRFNYRPDLLPSFTLKDSRNDVGRVLSATLLALESVVKSLKL